jgi:hypothetical protein
MLSLIVSLMIAVAVGSGLAQVERPRLRRTLIAIWASVPLLLVLGIIVAKPSPLILVLLVWLVPWSALSLVAYAISSRSQRPSSDD